MTAGGLMTTELFTDAVIEVIDRELAAHPPERGGALIGAGGIVHALVPDVAGVCTGASWDISEELTEHVQADELAGRGVLAGTVHTHPAGVADPSTQDVRATARLLDANPHLAKVVVVVVTEGPPRPGDLAVGDRHRMSVHVMRRSAEGHRFARARGRVLPLRAVFGDARRPVRGFRVTLDGVDTLAVPAGRSRTGAPVALAVPPHYPLVPPIPVVVAADGRLVPLPSPRRWDPSAEPEAQLVGLLDGALGRLPDGFTARTAGLAGSLRRRNVLVAGAGSVGSAVADALVRAGVGRVTVVDHDVVSGPNLARSVYTADDVGLPKVDALARHLQGVNPAVAVRRHAATLQQLVEAGTLAREIPRVDLVIGATDDIAGQSVLSHHAYHAGVPMVACALYRRAAAGEVVIAHPRRGTACWRCAIGKGAADRPAKDYGTGRLEGELALGPSIAVVAQTAALVAVGMLAGPRRPAGAATASLLDSGRTMGIVATTPGWEFFPVVFAGLERHQFAPQSVWATVERDPECPVCGDERRPPLGPGSGARLVHLRSELTQQLARAGATAPTHPDRPASPERAPEGPVEDRT